MFELKEQFGDHKIFRFNMEQHPFRKYLEDLYSTKDLEHIHNLSKEYKQYLNCEIESLDDIETDIHKKFYYDIKTNDTFKKIYCNFIKSIQTQFFPNEQVLIYQSFPSIRFQFYDGVAVPPHKDSDHLGQHPIGEKNFLVPITQMKNTNRIFIETECDKKDFRGVDLEQGDLFYFNGNTCTHYNHKNKEDYTRISFDFRILTLKDYINYVMNTHITTTNPRDPSKSRKPTKMIIGGYYQMMKNDYNVNDMMNWYRMKGGIMQSRPHFDDKERDALIEYLQGDNFLTEFTQTKELENKLCELTGSKHCNMVSNGTTALTAALLACGVGVGDDVIVPNYTMVATANSVKLIGANPVFIDITDDTNTINVKDIESNLTPSTKVVIHVSVNNRSFNIHQIADFCKERGIFLIEDAAQSVGCFHQGKHYGTFGDIGTFSFSTPKIISTGQGGAVVTDNDDLAKKITQIKNFGRESMNDYNTFGVNYKITDLQAVVGLKQLEKLPERIDRYKEIFNIYYSYLSKYMKSKQDDDWFPWFNEIYVGDRDKLMYFLKQHNIQTRPTYPQLNSLPHLKTNEIYPHSEYVANNGLFLPTHMLLSDKEISYICDLIYVFQSF